MKINILLALAFWLPLAGPAQALEPSIDQLLADGRLQVRTSVQPDAGAVVTQQVELVIEIATDRWFAGGTRIGLFAVDGALVLRRKSFATNLTRRIKGQTWTVQQWTITLHPQRGGVFLVPAISLELAIAGDDGRPVRGKATTLPLRFTAEIPAALAGLSPWVATSRLQVEENFDRELENLVPGDAITRRVMIEAEDLPALLLPALVIDKVEGLGVYPQQPRLDDINERGVVRGTRREEVTYIIEQEGRFEFPPQTFYWWDTSLGVVQRHTLPALTIQTAGYAAAAGENTSSADEVEQPTSVFARVWLLGPGVALLGLLLWYRARHLPPERQTSRPAPLTARELERQLIRYCQRGETGPALAALYHWLDEQDTSCQLRPLLAGLENPQLEEQVINLLARYYGRGGSDTVGTSKIAQLLSSIRSRKSNTRTAGLSFELN